MKKMTSIDKLKALVIIGDQLWDDFDRGLLTEQEYGAKVKLLKKEIEDEINISFSDIQKISNTLGYMLVKKVNPFSRIVNFTISKN